jgi:hypothetical protein
VSLDTCAKAAADSRQAADGAASYPDGPGAVSSWRRTSGVVTGGPA